MFNLKCVNLIKLPFTDSNIQEIQAHYYGFSYFLIKFNHSILIRYLDTFLVSRFKWNPHIHQ